MILTSEGVMKGKKTPQTPENNKVDEIHRAQVVALVVVLVTYCCAAHHSKITGWKQKAVSCSSQFVDQKLEPASQKLMI